MTDLIDLLIREGKEGKRFFTTKYLSRRTKRSGHSVGQTMANLVRDGHPDLVVTRWSLHGVWLVEVIL